MHRGILPRHAPRLAARAMTYEEIRDRIAAQDENKARARAIVEIAEDLQWAFKTERARVISEEIGKAINVLNEARIAIEANPRKNPRRFILRWINNLSNQLSAISAGYAAGSLPKVEK
jgi:hypothetical protein